MNNTSLEFTVFLKYKENLLNSDPPVLAATVDVYFDEENFVITWTDVLENAHAETTSIISQMILEKMPDMFIKNVVRAMEKSRKNKDRKSTFINVLANGYRWNFFISVEGLKKRKNI